MLKFNKIRFLNIENNNEKDIKLEVECLLINSRRDQIEFYMDYKPF